MAIYRYVLSRADGEIFLVNRIGIVSGLSRRKVGQPTIIERMPMISRPHRVNVDFSASLDVYLSTSGRSRSCDKKASGQHWTDENLERYSSANYRPDDVFPLISSANDRKTRPILNAVMIGIESANSRPDFDIIGSWSVQRKYRCRADLDPDASGNDSPMFQN